MRFIVVILTYVKFYYSKLIDKRKIFFIENQILHYLQCCKIPTIQNHICLIILFKIVNVASYFLQTSLGPTKTKYWLYRSPSKTGNIILYKSIDYNKK